ncbi:hypothetical protein [Virgibacillus ihumii]|uniref:hypothetical protein n=1 Tax=Virgibacillus ihumii TaxID=2686091 RepID=UPI00157E01FA|nr:hypothetical protein [Virgibacillus ihumii]
MYHQPRPYPPVDTAMLTQSVNEFETLLHQGLILLDKLENKPFSYNLMVFAQRGNKAEVRHLIHSINGLYVPIQINFTPSAIIFNMEPPAVDGQDYGNCCSLRIVLKWGK